MARCWWRAVSPRISQKEQNATAELYDPGTGTWSSTGSLAKGRANHTATLLPNGKVLVVGGVSVVDGGPVPTVSAELYDPGTGTWSPTGSIAKGRLFHTATLLPNGKVLVTGGVSDDDNPRMSAEVYDPGTGTWSLTGSHIYAKGRIRHAAALLSNGKVLVTGGLGFFVPTEVYDPETGTWSPTGSPAKGRFDHAATLLPNGKVLVMGGSTLVGGLYDVTSEVYDPETGTWSPTGNLASGRASHSATLLAYGKVLVVSGNGGENQSLVSAEVYDPGTGTWSPTGSLAMARTAPSITLLRSGKVLVVGGTTYPTAEVYTP